MSTEDRDRLRTGVAWALARMSEKTRIEKCKRLEVSSGTLANWETGVGFPSEKNMARLANAARTDQESIRAGGE